MLDDGIEFDGIRKAKVALTPVLNDTKLRNLKPQDTLYKFVDRDGLYVVVSPGGAVSFRFDYRLNGRRETLTIGRYGARDQRGPQTRPGPPVQRRRMPPLADPWETRARRPSDVTADSRYPTVLPDESMIVKELERTTAEPYRRSEPSSGLVPMPSSPRSSEGEATC